MFHRESAILYINCLYLLEKKTELFSFAHKLADLYGKDAISWYAIGCYYLCIKRLSDARHYFGQSTNTDPKMAQAWIGYGLSFAFDGENDQAIAAFSTAMRLVPQCEFNLILVIVEIMFLLC